jgi:large subunit ribosomal protein L35
MPKLKSHAGLKKRLKVTAKGKLRHHSAYGSHLMQHKRRLRKLRLKKNKIVKRADKKKLATLAPYL